MDDEPTALKRNEISPSESVITYIIYERIRFGHKKYNLNLSCHQPHLAFLASQLIPHQMLSQSHSRCALIDYSERLFRIKILRFGLPLEALF